MIRKSYTKLKVPVFNGIEYDGRVIYFADPVLSSFSESIEEEFRQVIYKPCETMGIRFNNVRCSYANPFNPQHKNYDILFFDYGGMESGNNMLEFFSRKIFNKSEEFPNRLYCMVSRMTRYVMKEILTESNRMPANMFLDIEEVCMFLKN